MPPPIKAVSDAGEPGDADGLADGDGLGEADAEGEGEGEGEGEALGCGDPRSDGRESHRTRPRPREDQAATSAWRGQPTRHA